MKTIADVVKEVKNLYPTLASVEDNRIEAFAKKASLHIQNYCARNHVPDQAFYIWVDLTYMLLSVADKASSMSSGGGEVASVTQGSVSVTFKDGFTANTADDVYVHVNPSLNPFRLPRWR